MILEQWGVDKVYTENEKMPFSVFSFLEFRRAQRLAKEALLYSKVYMKHKAIRLGLNKRLQLR